VSTKPGLPQIYFLDLIAWIPADLVLVFLVTLMKKIRIFVILSGVILSGAPLIAQAYQIKPNPKYERCGKQRRV
jgi:hypothetical protein